MNSAAQIADFPTATLRRAPLLLAALAFLTVACSDSTGPEDPGGNPGPTGPAFESVFDTDLDGWATGTTTDGWGTSQWQEYCGEERDEGCIKLDGVGGDGLANAWVVKSFDLPADVSLLELETSPHNRSGADSEFRIRIVEGGAETVLVDWTAQTGAEDVLNWQSLSLDISAFAGSTVTIYLEGRDNGPGSNEQTYYDNVVIR